MPGPETNVSAGDKFGLGYAGAAAAATPWAVYLAGGGYSGGATNSHPKTDPVAAVYRLKHLGPGASNKLVGEVALPAKAAYPAAVADVASSGSTATLYVLGGVNAKGGYTGGMKSVVSSPVDEADTELSWSVLPEMNEGRWGFGVAISGGKLFAFGGMPEPESTAYKSSTEYLDLAPGSTWQYLSPPGGTMRVASAFHAVAMWGCSILKIGGYGGNGGSLSNLPFVEELDLGTLQWRYAQAPYGNLTGHGVSHADAIEVPIEQTGTAVWLVGGDTDTGGEDSTDVVSVARQAPCGLNRAGPGCSTCADGYYGRECYPCPGVQECGSICGGLGTCAGSGTTGGNGSCICNYPLTGDDCSVCPVPHKRDAKDECVDCIAGFVGLHCETCPGVPANASRLLPQPSCSGHGTCAMGADNSPICLCNAPWNGTVCDICPSPASGPLCDTCPDGQFGPKCEHCPDCGDHGLCDGTGTTRGSGQCVCNLGWSGPHCSSGFDVGLRDIGLASSLGISALVAVVVGMGYKAQWGGKTTESDLNVPSPLSTGYSHVMELFVVMQHISSIGMISGGIPSKVMGFSLGFAWSHFILPLPGLTKAGEALYNAMLPEADSPTTAGSQVTQPLIYWSMWFDQIDPRSVLVAAVVFFAAVLLIMWIAECVTAACTPPESESRFRVRSAIVRLMVVAYFGFATLVFSDVIALARHALGAFPPWPSMFVVLVFFAVLVGLAVKPIGHIQRVHSRRGGRELSIPLNPLRGSAGSKRKEKGKSKKAKHRKIAGGTADVEAGTEMQWSPLAPQRPRLPTSARDTVTYSVFFNVFVPERQLFFVWLLWQRAVEGVVLGLFFFSPLAQVVILVVAQLYWAGAVLRSRPFLAPRRNVGYVALCLYKAVSFGLCAVFSAAPDLSVTTGLVVIALHGVALVGVAAACVGHACSLRGTSTGAQSRKHRKGGNRHGASADGRKKRKKKRRKGSAGYIPVSGLTSGGGGATDRGGGDDAFDDIWNAGPAAPGAAESKGGDVGPAGAAGPVMVGPQLPRR